MLVAANSSTRISTTSETMAARWRTNRLRTIWACERPATSRISRDIFSPGPGSCGVDPGVGAASGVIVAIFLTT